MVDALNGRPADSALEPAFFSPLLRVSLAPDNHEHSHVPKTLVDVVYRRRYLAGSIKDIEIAQRMGKVATTGDELEAVSGGFQFIGSSLSIRLAGWV